MATHPISGPVSGADAAESGELDGREALLQATIRVVGRKGLRGATYRAIAEDAGVNNTLISYHFGSRRALLIAAMEWAVDHTAMSNDPAGLVDDPEGFARSVIRQVDADPELQLFQYELLIESRREPELSVPIASVYERYIASIAAALMRRGIERVEAAHRARAVFAALDGLVLQRLTSGAGADIESCVALVGRAALPPERRS